LAGLAVWLCAIGPGFAQAANIPVVGVLLINPQPIVLLIRSALAALGYLEGANLRLDFRFAEAQAERFPALAEELVRDKADVIVTLGDAATHAAQQATRTIPIVAIADDLVGAGLIHSMAKPGGNTTGVSILATELDAKKLEILKEIVPSARRFGVLRDPASTFPGRIDAIAKAGRSLGVELQTVDAGNPADFEAAFASFHAGGVDGIDILASPMLANSPEELARPASNTNCRRCASFARWSRPDVWRATASSAPRCTRCSPAISTRCSKARSRPTRWRSSRPLWSS
jgi:ABC-type uncharacterized transport system substrate-binding protein